MNPEPHVDPRKRPLQPTQEEIDAWAAREHRRRAAWLAGPSDEEKQEWARRYRWRAALGIEESRLGPAREDIDLWAAREHKRREAWLAGPSEAEKQSWAGGQRRRAGAGATDSPAPPTQEEIEAWAGRERQRRAAWLAGPSEEEKLRWAERQAGGFVDEMLGLLTTLEPDLPEAAQRFLSEAELAGRAALRSLSRVPMTLWSLFVRAGRIFEDDPDQQPPRRRVRY
jgi:hypothetical protein